VQFVNNYLTLLYGSSAPGVNETFPLVNHGASYKDPKTDYILFRTDECLRYNEDTCPNSSWEFYLISRNGVDGGC
jgi:hypothetical protein